MRSIAWDMLNTWPTSAEWLNWVRRRDGRKTLYCEAYGWHYPARPMISATRYPLIYKSE